MTDEQYKKASAIVDEIAGSVAKSDNSKHYCSYLIEVIERECNKKFEILQRDLSHI